MSARVIPENVLRVQTDASDPRVSAWVAANAGSGKTHVLAQRVIRLLLDGCEPSRILCLTFTKAAAANMASRVFDTLARWTTLEDAALDGAIMAVEGSRPDPRRRARARRLFADALETPGGLKVQTIHAFCTRLLHQFPFEADVAARFTVMEDRAETELIDALRVQVLLEAANAPESPLGLALATAIANAADQTFADVIREAIGKRDDVTHWVTRAGSVAAAVAELSGALGIDPADTVASIEADFFTGPHLPVADWPAAMAALSEGSASEQEHVARLTLAQGESGIARIDAYLSVFCTATLVERQRLLTKGFYNKHPALAERLVAEQKRVCALLARRRAAVTRDRTAALLAIASEVIARYHAEKARRGLLDYDDLIDKTLALFRRVSASWVHYKLDRGFNHVLVDEAQDTSPKQWDVVKALVSEFFAGEGARSDVTRTIFAVGDEKQSIFSFQGAAPHQFDEMRRHFETRHRDGEIAFVERKFQYSFRSGPTVLGAVDTVFGRPQAYEGLAADPVKTVHQSIRDQAPGLVEVWPMVEPEQKPDIDPWDAPFDTTSETTPVVRLAHKVAASVKAWIAQRELIGDAATRRPVRPGDILVLVRQRGALFEAVIRALKQAGIAVAGADRLVLTEHIAVMDLIALADALLLPEDDLALATILKSPLFGWDEDQLFALAWNRRGSLRAALHARSDQLHAADAAARLDQLTEWSRRESPFAFYARVLGPERGRARMLARLGPEATDALDEFLNLALDYERRETPSLQGFVAWLRASPAQIKRDMEIARDEVRVMTVHGAKGLEAPVVILADTTSRPSGPREPRLLIIDPLRHGAASCLVWAGAKATDVPPVAASRDAARHATEDEHRRLLYVAMTRAADRLIVCGARGQTKAPEGCWYELVHDALVPQATEVPAANGDGSVWRIQKSAPDEPVPAAPPPPGDDQHVRPAWLTENAPSDAAPAFISPSRATEGLGAASPAGSDARRKARQRGDLVHRLMQSLPDIPAARRREAGLRYLGRNGEAFTESERDALVGRVLAVLDDPRFAPLAGPGSRAEAAIVGRLPRPGLPPLSVSGQVDRIAVTPQAVVIADYKTDRRPPTRVEDVKPAYIAQLAVYRAVLASLYPDRPVRALLVWVDIVDFMEVPASALDAALARVTTA